MTTDDVLKIATPIAVIVAAIMQQMVAAAARAEVKAKLESTAKVTDQKIEVIAKTAESVHTLVNSNMGTQLRVSMVALQRVADLTKNAADIEAAKLASKLFNEHEKNQKTVDDAAGKPASATPPPA